jgi:hypothetical protein
MRNRVEDLGRIYELLKEALQYDSLLEATIHTDLHVKEFFKKSPDDQYNKLHDFYNDLYQIKELVYDCMQIAAGEDELNLVDGTIR